MSNYWRTYKVADEMGVSRISAGTARIKYLRDRIESYGKFDNPAAKIWAKDHEDEIAYLYQTMTQEPAEGRITDEDIERAREFPVNELIDFNRGKALAFCHEDSKPSLSYSEKTGKARCFVCNKTFNAIDILVERDGMRFIEAVKWLI